MDYFAVFCHEYGYTNHIFRKSGGWRLVTRSCFFFKYFCNGFYGSLNLVLTSACHLPHNNGKCWCQHIIYHTTMESADVSISFTTQQWKVLTSAYNLSHNNGKCWRQRLFWKNGGWRLYYAAFYAPGDDSPMGAYCFYCVRMYVCMYVRLYWYVCMYVCPFILV